MLNRSDLFYPPVPEPVSPPSAASWGLNDLVLALFLVGSIAAVIAGVI